MDHQADFELLVLKKFGEEEAEKIDWSGPRLLCIAEKFDRYDVHAVQQINRNIELIRYLVFGDELLLLSLVNVVVATAEEEGEEEGAGKPSGGRAKQYTTQAEYLEKASPELRELYDAVREHMMDLGDDVQEKVLKWYIAFKRLKNFACIQVHTQKNCLVMWLDVDPDEVALEEGFSRDVRGLGHHGTGDLEVTIEDLEDLEKAKPLIEKSFEAS
jgi:predicted transport protein